MTLGKAFGNGFPLSGLLTTNEISQAKPWGIPSGSSSSYGSNPLGAAAGAAALRIIDEERLTENAAAVGGVMLRELETFVDRYPFVGFVQGAGLLIRMELVRDRKTKEPVAKALTQALYQECLRRGLVAMTYTTPIRINPPLVIAEETALEGLAILDEALEVVLREHGLQ